MTNPALERARAFSDGRLEEVRACVSPLVPADAIVVACGSYARREASAASDFDYFAIAPASTIGWDAAPPWAGHLRQALADVIKIVPAPDGAFGKIETRQGMILNIGGQGDDNQKLTRRMLFLLEGVPLNAAQGFREVRRSILERYLRGGAESGALALFLLNDVIRYYRTVAVDYEYKTTEGATPKPWGLRNVKLMFSRKLLYASGLFSVAATMDLPPRGKADRLEALLDLSVTERMVEICGDRGTAPLLACYDGFLNRLADTGTRLRLQALTRDDHADPLFGDIKEDGRRFATALIHLFEDRFGPGHPIHRAMIL